MSKSILQGLVIGAALLAATGSPPLIAQSGAPQEERRAIEEQMRAVHEKLRVLHERLEEAARGGR